LLTAQKNSEILVNSLSTLKTIDVIDFGEEELAMTDWNGYSMVAAGGDFEGNGIVKLYDLRKTSKPVKEKKFDGLRNGFSCVKALSRDNLLLVSDKVSVSDFFKVFLAC
jgi:hypothetical protein